MSLAETIAPYAAGTVAAALVYAALKRKTARTQLPLPPGPKPLPVIGNLLDIPQEKEWLTYRSWTEQFGDVVFVEALGQKIVVLGSATAVNDLMERRSAVYSDRSTLIMMNELMGFKWLLSTMMYGDKWRRGRKMLHAHVHSGVSPSHWPVQIQAARQFVQTLFEAPQTPETLPQIVRTTFAQTIVKMVYGIDVKDPKSDYITVPEKALEALNVSMLPGRFLVDVIPVLQYVPEWFPGAGFIKYAKETQDITRRMRDVPMDQTKKDMAKGCAPHSVVRAMLEDSAAANAGTVPHDEEAMISDLAGITYMAGADTTVSAVIAFFLAMVVYPDVQKKAQAELDRVVGRDRLPELTDEPDLPYISGVVSECLRWQPVLPMGVPHAASRDDEYNGYLIPKGSIVMGSAWAILHNEDDYPEPEEFKPERYLTVAADGSLHRDPNIRDPRTAAFGFGRRICPGRHVADASLFASIATTLATLDVGRVVGSDGKERIPTVDVTSGLLSHPRPFEYTLRPRSEKALAMLAASVEH